MANNSDYRVAQGHDVILGSLNVFSPQPTAEGVQATRRTNAASGDVYDEAKYVELVWTVVETPTELDTILDYFGMGGVPILHQADVTVYVRNELYIFTRYNGVAVFPQLGRDLRWKNYFPRNLTMLIKNLVLV